MISREWQESKNSNRPLCRKSLILPAKIMLMILFKTAFLSALLRSRLTEVAPISLASACLSHFVRRIAAQANFGRVGAGQQHIAEFRRAVDPETEIRDGAFALFHWPGAELIEIVAVFTQRSEQFPNCSGGRLPLFGRRVLGD